MPIKNYTTKVDAAVTVGQIQAALERHGAKKIMIEYDEDCNVNAVTFAIMTGSGMQGVRLPANPERVLAVLHNQKVKSAAGTARRMANLKRLARCTACNSRDGNGDNRSSHAALLCDTIRGYSI